MVSLMSLWLPIVVSAVFVFIASSVLHMVFKYHNSDFKKIPGEDELMEAMRPHNIPKGLYSMPHAADMEGMKSKEYLEKRDKGPVAMITVAESGDPGMGKSLSYWFLYSLFISFFAAYIAGRALGPDAHYLAVFRFVGAASFAGYSLALVQNSIWYRHPWSVTLKSMFDGLIYALLTAGTFGWLWS